MGSDRVIFVCLNVCLGIKTQQVNIMSTCLIAVFGILEGSISHHPKLWFTYLWVSPVSNSILSQVWWSSCLLSYYVLEKTPPWCQKVSSGSKKDKEPYEPAPQSEPGLGGRGQLAGSLWFPDRQVAGVIWNAIIWNSGLTTWTWCGHWCSCGLWGPLRISCSHMNLRCGQGLRIRHPQKVYSIFYFVW